MPMASLPPSGLTSVTVFSYVPPYYPYAKRGGVLEVLDDYHLELALSRFWCSKLLRASGRYLLLSWTATMTEMYGSGTPAGRGHRS